MIIPPKREKKPQQISIKAAHYPHIVPYATAKLS